MAPVIQSPGQISGFRRNLAATRHIFAFKQHVQHHAMAFKGKAVDSRVRLIDKSCSCHRGSSKRKLRAVCCTGHIH